ncbi:MAG: HPr family phosphocarrier protein [Elusimicrobiaceae bacterium]|nr:HPr family phosphocarrier protein [Elusimicrobiaceae bacterium]MBQ6224508.1 HPr family phosphocarrier protein [Campylobacter sp.]
MIQEKIKIKNKLGIHARPATLLAQEAGKFKSEIFIAKDGIEVNAKSIMGIMMIAAEQGAVLNLTINGEDEKEAVKALKNIFDKIFEEE